MMHSHEMSEEDENAMIGDRGQQIAAILADCPNMKMVGMVLTYALSHILEAQGCPEVDSLFCNFLASAAVQGAAQLRRLKEGEHTHVGHA